VAAKEDFQKLLDGALPFAKRMLLEEGEFIPFGASLTSNAAATLVAGDVGKEHPKSDEVVKLLTSTFATEAANQKIVAAAICFMASTTTSDGAKQEVAVFRMSHVSGETIDIFLPYSFGKSSRAIFKEIFATKGSSNFLTRHLQ